MLIGLLLRFIRHEACTMNDFALSKYMYETIASGSANQLQVSSVCNARCIFCSNDMNPFKIFREGFRPLKDIRKGIALLNAYSGEIRLGDSLPGRISEGEALLHPDIVTILKLIREKLPRNTIQISTNGVILTKEFIDRIAPYKPMKLTISYHSDNPKYWCKIFRLPKAQYTIARNSFLHLSKGGFLLEGALVPLPNLVGYKDIENTIKMFKCFSKHIIVYPPGYSVKASAALRKILNVDYRMLSRFLIKMRKKYKVNLLLKTDLLMPLSFSPYLLMQRSFNSSFQNVLWLFSEASYQKARKILKEFNPFVPNEHHAVMVKNYTYRGNIICSGLLMVQDYRRAIKKALGELRKKKVHIDLLVLPSNSFDRYGDDLKGENYSTLSDEFNIPVWHG